MSTPLTSIFDPEFSSRMLIEASAGTGKTFTIEGMVVRLLIEKKLPIEKILVVTFTRMATKELKMRILNRLREAKLALSGDREMDDEFLNELCHRHGDSPEAPKYISEAVHNFDEAQIYTIHGFCQKILKEEALLTGAPFDLELVQSDPYMEEAIQDFWRTFIFENSREQTGKYLISLVRSLANSPEELGKILNPLLSNRDATIERPEPIDAKQYLKSVLMLRERLRSVWNENEEEIRSILTHCDIPRYSSYLESRFRHLLSFLEDKTYSISLPDKFKYFTSGYLYHAKLKKGGKPTEHHLFFEIAEEYQNLVQQLPNITSQFLYEAAESIHKLRKRAIQRTSTFTYDDLLHQLRSALHQPENGDKLSATLRQKFPFALVDEFQDTDPIQFEIFDKIYPEESSEGTLLMIGDPKQAIYGFRGADIYAYLRAKKNSDSTRQYTLEKNFRSTEQMVEAINALFSMSADPFVETQIKFIPSKPGKKNLHKRYRVSDESYKPVKITYVPGVKTVEETEGILFEETARQIAKLIQQGKDEELKIHGKAVSGGDIAVLVSKNREADQIKSLLKNFGIDSITYSRQNVFETREADLLQLIMKAVLEPSDPVNINNLLITGVMGSNLNALYRIQEDDEQNRNLLLNLLNLNDLWQKEGFYTAFRKLMIGQDGLINLSEFENSERLITNIFQIAELCAFEEQEHGLNGSALLYWLQKQIKNASSNGEDTLRLDSDQNLVKISTIHNSKGLQFPIVFCPTLWSGKSISIKNSDIITYHDPKLDDQLAINIEQSDSATRNRAVHLNLMERMAEEVRKSYVATTRAQFECRILWGATKNTLFSGLSASFNGREKIKEFISENRGLKDGTDLDGSQIGDIFKSLEQKHPDLFSFSKMGQVDSAVADFNTKNKPTQLSKKEWKGPDYLQPDRALHSFSSLVFHDSELNEEPDRDQILARYVEPELNLPNEYNIFTFPRGASAGTLIHQIFEHEKFDFRAGGTGKNRLAAEETIEQFGQDFKWIPVLTEMTDQVCGAVIEDFRFSEIEPEHQLREMEFYLAINKPEIESITKLIRGDTVKVDFPGIFKNYLKGFIDLIVEQNDKYYIIDYKSNYLGDSLKDYDQANLKESILTSGYDIQYHIYTLALVTILRDRLPGFDYNQHFGGVAYLYIRGMETGTDKGIWFDKPNEDIIHNLEQSILRK